jgi:hypothetical protein
MPLISGLLGQRDEGATTDPRAKYHDTTPNDIMAYMEYVSNANFVYMQLYLYPTRKTLLGRRGL